MEYMKNFLDHFFLELSDPRTRDWPLMGYPIKISILLLIYLGFVKIVGPKLMQNREPFDLKKIMIVYNVVLVIFSAYLSLDGTFNAFFSGAYKVSCQPVDFTRSYIGMRAAYGCYYFYIKKIMELLDTVFFVLRKKYDQITFLHLFHHVSMVSFSYMVVNYYPGGTVVFYGTMNSIVHTVMYTYYLLAALGPSFKKYLWWKKYITTLQMSQFIIGALHGLYQLTWNSCGLPRWPAFIGIPYVIALFFLFQDFYVEKYKEYQAQRKKEILDENQNKAKTK